MVHFKLTRAVIDSLTKSLSNFFTLLHGYGMSLINDVPLNSSDFGGNVTHFLEKEIVLVLALLE
jgi:hypothetical protein